VWSMRRDKIQTRFITRCIVVTFCSVSVLSNVFAATFTVTKTSDTFPNGKPGELRWAIQQSNKTAGAHVINFNIPGTGPFEIKPVEPLDLIRKKVTIDGYSQPCALANSLAQGSNARLLIVLSGSNYTVGSGFANFANGLTFVPGSEGSVVKGLVFNEWLTDGIFINSADNITVVGNFIGTNADGTAEKANQAGIFIEFCKNTVIGTADPADRNVIAGSFLFFNASAGIVTHGTKGVSIKNNYVGLDKTGTVALGNSLAGITCFGSTDTVIGGATPAERNVVSGHVVVGVSLEGSSNSVVQGNYIGTDVSGTSALGNSNIGLFISGHGLPKSATNNAIQKNLISGNRIGIKLGDAIVPGANGNRIKGNLIGTDASGSVGLSNQYGIVVNDNTNEIGGITNKARNVVSGNTKSGILVYGGAHSTIIRGNYIGLASDGVSPLPNGFGIQLGLSGAKGAAGKNSIHDNAFGGGNTTSSLCVVG